MIIIVLLIFVSLSIAIAFLFAFLWNVRSGQYDDMYTPSVRMLFDEKKQDLPEEPGSKENNSA